MISAKPKLKTVLNMLCGTVKMQLIPISIVCMVLLIVTLAMDDTITRINNINKDTKINIKWKGITLSSNITFSVLNAPIVGITKTNKYKYQTLLDTIKSNGLETHKTEWKDTYYAWWNINTSMSVMYGVSIASCVTIFISIPYMYLHRSDGFIVSPETSLFLISAVMCISAVVQYLVNVWGTVKQNKDPWSNNNEFDCSFKSGCIMLIIVMSLLIIGIIMYLVQWKQEVYILHRTDRHARKQQALDTNENDH
eukprot:512994_1